jgi:hypothetical protein
METIIGFVVGYVVGTRQGRDGVRQMLAAVDDIRNSPEARDLVLTGMAIARSTMGQVLGGGAGAILTGAAHAVSKKADSLLVEAKQAA